MYVPEWILFFYQLEEFVELSEIIAPLLLKYPKAPTMLSTRQLEFIKDLINILRSLETTKEISGEDYIVFKKNNFSDKVACPWAIDRINTLILNILQQQLPQNKSEETEEAEGNDMEKGIKLLVKNSLHVMHLHRKLSLNEEFKHYLSQATTGNYLKYASIFYWQEQKNSIYHHVHSTSMKYVYRGVICTGDITSDERNRLDPNRLDRLLFLKSLAITNLFNVTNRFVK